VTQEFETNSTAARADLARFLNLPLYFFDLDAVLEHTNSTLAESREQRVAVAERLLADIDGTAVSIPAATGFYLIVQSARGALADDVAERLNTALLLTLFGTAATVPERFKQLFRPVSTGAGNAKSAPTEVPILPAPANEESDDDALETNVRESRDIYSELALKGQMPNQNVELLFHPVHDLLRGRSTTFFCTPAFCVGGEPVIHGYKAFEGVSPRDLPFIDRAMLAHSLKFNRRMAQAGVFTATGTYVSFETLAHPRSREIYQEALRAAGVPDYPSLVLCIKDLPVGITASRIAELVGYLRPLAKRVFVQLPNAETPILNCGYLGANGFVLSQPGRQTPAQSERNAVWLARVAESQMALTTIDQIESESELEAIRRTPVRFGMGPAFGPTLFRGSSEPIEVESFMKAAARAAQSETRGVRRFGPRSETRAGAEKVN
jgi:hypothetical protein